MRWALVATAIASPIISAEELSPAIELPKGHTGDSLLTRWKEPHYPSSAIKSGITGEVVVEFDVNMNGRLSNTKIVQAQPEGVFDEEVRSTLSEWTVIPYMATRCYTDFPRSRVHVSFRLANGLPTVSAGQPKPLTDPIAVSKAKKAIESPQKSDGEKPRLPLLKWKRTSEPRYPKFLQSREPMYGDVAAKITIAPDGKPENVEILFSSPHPAFGEAAKHELMSWEAETTTGEPLNERRTLCQPLRFRPAK
ncbi:MAG: TonB family protein [Betaproteobacteria bacterium]|nr:TonB family protein [Betaproteobacteria bacterium]